VGSVLVSHPHAAAFANATAAALESEGCLAEYYTGLAAANATAAGWLLGFAQGRKPALRNRLIEGVPGSKLRSLFLVETAARAMADVAMALGIKAPSRYDAMFLLHDRVVAALSWSPASAVYAYEDGALQTFRRAAQLGLRRIWDLPLPHYATVEAMWREEYRRWPQAVPDGPRIEPDWKKKRKDSELALATTVSVASAFTRSSLEGVGLQVPVTVTPYGFPINDFLPKASLVDGRFTVLSVGSQNIRKGTHYLLQAWKQAGLKDARLRLVGTLQLAPSFLARYEGLYEHVPHVPRRNLTVEYQTADLVAFPTLCDGFGLVTQEAMCCGTPVVTTRCGGGPECIDDGVNGWLIPDRSVDALVDVLRWTAAHRERSFEMGQEARRRAERWTWRQAGEALASAFCANS